MFDLVLEIVFGPFFVFLAFVKSLYREGLCFAGVLEYIQSGTSR